MSTLPILYSFRRCPFAIRARMALLASGQTVRLREVILRDKPAEMLAASPKGTVPVLVLADGQVIDESLAIMRWALARCDPECWLAGDDAPIAMFDTAFKYHLDRYKYPVRYDDIDPLIHRAAAADMLAEIEPIIAHDGWLGGAAPRLADYAVFPFIRQFAMHDPGWFDAQRWPALHRWLERMTQDGLFQHAMVRHPAWRAGEDEPLFAAAVASSNPD
ncbi:MAG: glutathione S-transferase [Parasphingorhabdus sp.]|nr:glutathione S-transferase [Parasphingorhabdus sp.]